MTTYSDPKHLPPDVRQKLLLIRTAIIANDLQEANHWLYAIASPGFCCLDPWAALEGRVCSCGPHGTDGDPIPTVEGLEDVLRRVHLQHNSEHAK